MWVDVLDIRKRSTSGHYVEVPEIHSTGFERFSLSAGIASDVFPDKQIVLRFVGMRPFFGDEQLPRLVIWKVVNRNGDDLIAGLEIPTPGVWRASFGKAFSEGKTITQRTRYLYFEWVEGKGVTPWAPK